MGGAVNGHSWATPAMGLGQPGGALIEATAKRPDPAVAVVEILGRALIASSTYSDAQREAAATALRRRAAAGRIASEAHAGTSTDGERYGETVDALAAALGLERAGV